MFFRQDSRTNDELFCSISRSICHARQELESEAGSSSISHVTALKLPSRTEVKNKRFQMKTYPPVFLQIVDIDCLVQVFPSNDTSRTCISNTLTAVGALGILLSNARRFYSPVGNPLAVKGLKQCLKNPLI